MRRTKILATVGPASEGTAELAALLDAGADSFRLNFSHGSAPDHRELLRRIHEAAQRRKREPAVVADVQGPKLRIGELAGGAVELVAGREWRLDDRSTEGDGRRVGIHVPSFSRLARPGDPILLGDGNVELVVRRVASREILARVVNGGAVSSHAGLFLPHARLRVSAFGPKDRRDAALGLAEGIDYLALSFVRNRADVRAARKWLDRQDGGRDVGIIAKIERAEALAAIDSILAVADGIMVARGDLGIEVPLERLALEQKMLVRRANDAGRFAIVATQMLLSMVRSPRPTRAEATDVANAVLDGADAVMLSEESAVGAYPVESVRWLARIADATESSFDVGALRARQRTVSSEPDRAVAAAAVELADRVGARAVVTPTHSGRTARLVARLRPGCPVVALSNSGATRRRLALVGGVVSMPAPVHRNLIELRTRATQLLDRALPGSSGPLVLTAGYPVEGRPTNLVTLVDGEAEPPAPRPARASRRPVSAPDGR